MFVLQRRLATVLHLFVFLALEHRHMRTHIVKFDWTEVEPNFLVSEYYDNLQDFWTEITSRGSLNAERSLNEMRLQLLFLEIIEIEPHGHLLRLNNPLAGI